MKYQMVLQFRGDSLADHDQMVALEDGLIAALRDTASVDGHDVGSGETNIFILTDDPKATFRQVKLVLERMGRLTDVRAAYRPVDGERYSLIWPEGDAREFRVV
jgi:hypothetical protein